MPAIGPYTLRNPVVLAPMAGITDAVFRRLAWRAGVGYMVGEMTSAVPHLWNSAKSTSRRVGVAGALHAVQIAGAEPAELAAVAERHWQAGAEVIDINFGCPAKKVCRRAAGSALLAEPDLVQRLTAAVVAAVPVPVTAKLRTGPTPEWRNAPDVARRLEDAGVAALTVHGRTRACKFLGWAEYDTIAAVKAAVSVPVIANGDIASAAAARRVLRHTAADAVMIGRAALGAPWLPGRIAAALAAGSAAAAEPPLEERLDLLLDQVGAMHALYGPEQGVRVARKHVQWTLGHSTLSAAQRQALHPLYRRCLKISCATQQLDALALIRRAAAAGFDELMNLSTQAKQGACA